MTNESIDSLLARPFDGRVVPLHNDPLHKYSDFDGDPVVVYPWSDEGLSQAIKIKELLGGKGFLRSGLSSSGDGRLHAEGGIVVDFSCFTRIDVRQTGRDADERIIIAVEAGANIQQLANVLIRANAFLPLGDNPVQSVVSSVLSGNPGYFDRSMGRLGDYVEDFEVITPRGEMAHFKKGDGEFQSILDGAFGGAIKVITFSALVSSSKTIEMMYARFFYAPEDFEAALRLLSNPNITPTMDLSVHAYHDVYGLVVVSVNIAGKPGDHDRMTAVLDQLKLLHREGPAPEEAATHIRLVETSNLTEIVELMMKGGLSGSHYVDRNLACQHYEKVIGFNDFDSFRASFVKNMTIALADMRGGVAPQVVGSVRLSLDKEKRIVVSAYAFLPKGWAEAGTRFDKAATRLMGNPVKSRPRAAAEILDRRVSPPIVDLSSLQPVAPAAKEARIPGFHGLIYAPGDPDYDRKRTQYASSSYPEEQGPTGSMHPCMVAYPAKGTDDIGTAIRYAVEKSKKVQARSGGHQYCGLSSGGMDTILLSMDLYNDIAFSEEDGKSLATVGVGALLTDIAAKFNSAGVTIPHGECPRVAIGGHVQTGGYGHFLRSYGLALDHVYRFKIYRADGELVTVKRPPARDENSLFWGVLGGGPGSFGILTEITFECLRDVDHPNSWGFKGAFAYSKPLFGRAMEMIQLWTNLVKSNNAVLPPDVDMCMTVVSNWLQPIYLLELVNGNKRGPDDDGSKNNAFLMAVKNNIIQWYNINLDCDKYEGKKALSFMANSFVRRSGTTPDGREFPEPYKKRLNCTKLALTTTFVASFVDLLDRVVNSSKVLLCFQMFIGGGAYASPVPTPPVNAICHRDVTLGIVFDCFYKPGGEYEAEQFQSEMSALLGEYSGPQEIRMLWGSFGDTQIREESVRKCYYDDITWNSLQQLKKQVDTGDLFHTRFTVQLPRNETS